MQIFKFLHTKLVFKQMAGNLNLGGPSLIDRPTQLYAQSHSAICLSTLREVALVTATVFQSLCKDSPEAFVAPSLVLGAPARDSMPGSTNLEQSGWANHGLPAVASCRLF